MSATWNPADKGANIALSNGNLTAEATIYAAMDSVRATESKSSGKWYWEIYVDHKYQKLTNGVGNSSANLNSMMGYDANSWGYVDSGKKIHNSSEVAYGNSYTTGDIIGVALNLDTGKIWFAKNNAWQASGDPAAGTNEAYSGLSGSLYPMGSCGRDNGDPNVDKQTIRPYPVSQSYSPPAGFSSFNHDSATNLFDGKVRIKNDATNLFDGKVSVNSPVNLFDGKVRIKNDATNLFDGKVSVNSPVNLFDGKVRIKNNATNLFNGKARIKDDATNLFDGRLIVTYTGQISASCPTPTGQLTVGKRLFAAAPTPTCEIVAVFRYARIDADVPVPTASFKVGRIIEGDSPVPDFTCTANIGRYPSLIASAPCPTCSMRTGLVLSDVATISQKAGVPIPTCVMMATTHHVATIFGNMPCPLLTCTADTENITTLTAPVPCPRGLFEATVGNVADILGRTPCPTCSIVAITGNVITLAGSVPVPGPLVRFLASPMNVNITLDGTVPTPCMISCVHGLTALILRHIRGEVR